MDIGSGSSEATAMIGRTIQVDAVTRQIVGVMPRGFRMVDQDFDLLLPAALDRTHQKLAPFGADGIARLKPGVTLAAGGRGCLAADCGVDGLVDERAGDQSSLLRAFGGSRRRLNR